MACIYPAPSRDYHVLYPYIETELHKLLDEESYWVPAAANAAALIGFLLHDLNWAGFYLYNGVELVLGPFWGKPAVTRIPLGKGVCGTSAQTQETIVVPDVHQYPGHIACDLYSNSEIVIPLVKNGALIGVLDIDSPEINRFMPEDKAGLEQLAQIIIEKIDFKL